MADQSQAVRATALQFPPTWFLRWAVAVEFLSFEFFLTRLFLPNGGGIILLRTFGISVLIMLAGFALRNFIDPNRSWDFSITELRLQMLDMAPWAGAVFAGTYAALYARFAKQTDYLAGLYNQIKAAESQAAPQSQVIAQWKAGFLEDAQMLHLATKPLFASIVSEWANDDSVRAHFESLAAGGTERLKKLRGRVAQSIDADRNNW